MTALPCPFCGNKGGAGVNTHTANLYGAVGCADCGCCIEAISLEDAMTRWNRRTNPEPPLPTAQDEALPCPFCGQRAVIVGPVTRRSLWRVVCLLKGCGVHPRTPNCASRDAALVAWNQRTALAAAREAGIEQERRRCLWLHHGHATFLYGDDGEMQCSHPSHGPLDFKRMPLGDLIVVTNGARMKGPSPIEEAHEAGRRAGVVEGMERARTVAAEMLGKNAAVVHAIRAALPIEGPA